MNRQLASLMGLVFFMLSGSCKVAAQTGVIENFGDPNSSHLWQQLQAIENGQRQTPLRILQLGDSHTAGDYFSGRLRELLQARYGNAGIGWITPGYVTNQRSAQVGLRNKGVWELFDSKKLTNRGPFPLGGFYTTSAGNSIIEINLKTSSLEGAWQINLWQQSASTPWSLALKNRQFFKFPTEEYNTGKWTLSSITLDTLTEQDVFLLAPKGGKLGGITLDKKGPGITLDALGINGATVAAINRWDESSLQQQLAWRNPELIILAYGTNEAFDSDLQQADYETELRQALQKLRQSAPHAAVVIIGAPGTAKAKPPYQRGVCRLALPPNLITVQKSQKQIAQQEKTLYWDWSAIMGGNCGVSTWVSRKPALMRPDMIHFTAEGYAFSAEQFYEALMRSVRDHKPTM
jgi:lysophospholipase L1-like esterase